MKSIFKYPIPVTDIFILNLPVFSEVLTVQVQHEEPCIWALVDTNPELVTEERFFVIHGTGHQVTDSDRKKYIGTFQLHGGSLVFHLFEVI